MEIILTHSVNYLSKVDEISIKHEAFKRDGFALGAIIAAEWLIDKKGVFSMDEFLKFNISMNGIDLSLLYLKKSI